MRLKKFFNAVGWSIAIAGLMFAVFEAGQMTLERLAERSKQPYLKVATPIPDNKRTPVAPPTKPQPLPPDYAVFVLCYHDFRDKPNKWSITPERLETHLQTLKALGFTFLTVSEAVDLLTGKWNGSLPERAVVITVDDGFQSAYTVLFPLLKRYGAKATLFVYTDWIDKSRGALTWEQLREMAQSGLVEIASHTVTHPYPRRLKRTLSHDQYRSRMKQEFEQSKRELEQKLGIKVNGIAYPGGHVDETMKALAEQVGYRWAVSVNPKPMTVGFDRYAIPRYGVGSETTTVALKLWVTKRTIQLTRFSRETKRGAKVSKSNVRNSHRVSVVRRVKR